MNNYVTMNVYSIIEPMARKSYPVENVPKITERIVSCIYETSRLRKEYVYCFSDCV